MAIFTSSAVMAPFHFRAFIQVPLEEEVDMINCARLSLHRAQGVLQSCLKASRAIEIEVSQHAWFDRFQGAQDWRPTSTIPTARS